MSAHGIPEGYIDPEDRSVKPSPELVADIADYSFDRAIICDRHETVDVLLYNNFHFENNCAVLAHDGYPEESFGSSAEFVGKTVFHRRLRRPRCSPSLKASLASSAAAPALTLGCAPRCRRVWAMGNGASGGGSGHRV